MDSDVELYAPINTGKVTASNGQTYTVVNGQVRVPGTCVAALMSSGYRPKPASEIELRRQSAADVGLNVTIYVAASRALLASDNGVTLDCAPDITLTVPAGLPSGFAVSVQAAGTTSVAASGVLLDGTSSTVTRAAASNKMFAIVAKAASDSYTVTGS